MATFSELTLALQLPLLWALPRDTMEALFAFFPTCWDWLRNHPPRQEGGAHYLIPRYTLDFSRSLKIPASRPHSQSNHIRIHRGSIESFSAPWWAQCPVGLRTTALSSWFSTRDPWHSLGSLYNIWMSKPHSKLINEWLLAINMF